MAFEGPKGNVVRAGNDAKGIAQIAFFPARKTVKAGDTVKFEMSKDIAPTTATAPSTPVSSTPTRSRRSRRATTVTFTKAGTYTFYCAVHGTDMSGQIVVQ